MLVGILRAQTLAWLPAFGIFNVHTYADACECKRGLCGHRKKVYTPQADWEKTERKRNPFPIQGLEPASVCSWLFSWTLCIPTELSPPLTIMKLDKLELTPHTRRRPTLLANGKQFGEDVTRCDQDSERVKR